MGSRYPTETRAILRAMQRYGIALADQGSAWYVSASPDERWNDDMLHLLDGLTGDDCEAVDASVLMSTSIPPEPRNPDLDSHRPLRVRRPASRRAQRGASGPKGAFAMNCAMASTKLAARSRVTSTPLRSTVRSTS